MEKLKKITMILSAIALLVLAGAQVQAQSADDVFQQIARSIQAGNSASLTTQFAANVEVATPAADGAYSSKQAQFVVADFFKDFPVKSFKIVHKGNSGSTHYAVGSYTSTKGVFDTNIFIKKIGGKFVVSQIRFEAE